MENLKEFMYPISKTPELAKDIIVFMFNGEKKLAHCTRICTSKDDYVQWFDNKKRTAIDINKIKGWVYKLRVE